MDIKSLQPNSRQSGQKFKQGYYNPENPGKYAGAMPIIYRSGWEYKMCRLLDLNDKVLKWGSESLKIRYFSRLDNKYHEYFPDFFFVYRDAEGQITKYVIEVKPKKYLTAPQKPSRLTENTLKRYKYDAEAYIKNMEKAEACKAYCLSNGLVYKFVTEDSNLPNL